MKNIFKAIALFAALASAGGIALAQSHSAMMGSHKGSSVQSMMTADQMMATCEEMMKDMRSDPVLMKHMNAIMQRHMMHGMMNGNMHSSKMNTAHPSATPHR